MSLVPLCEDLQLLFFCVAIFCVLLISYWGPFVFVVFCQGVVNVYGSTGYEFPYNKENFYSGRSKQLTVCGKNDRSLNPSQVERSFQNRRSKERVPLPNREQLRAYFQLLFVS